MVAFWQVQEIQVYAKKSFVKFEKRNLHIKQVPRSVSIKETKKYALHIHKLKESLPAYRCWTHMNRIYNRHQKLIQAKESWKYRDTIQKGGIEVKTGLSLIRCVRKKSWDIRETYGRNSLCTIEQIVNFLDVDITLSPFALQIVREHWIYRNLHALCLSIATQNFSAF
jgi:hypothetical protein